MNVTNYNIGSGDGYSGLYSNVSDLQIFIEALFRERILLSATSLDQMLTFTEEEEGANRANGLGIFKDFLERPADQFAYGHRGRDLGYTADLFGFPNQDYTMTYLINYGTDANSSLRPVFMSSGQPLWMPSWKIEKPLPAIQFRCDAYLWLAVGWSTRRP